MLDILWLVILGLVLLIAGTAAWASLFAAPYVPTKSSEVERLLDLAQLKSGDRLVDLGAGDGRIVVAAARRGAQAVGYEISLLPYIAAKLRLLFAGRSPRAVIKYQNFYQVDLAEFNVIIVFLLPSAMKKLGSKFKRELKPGTKIISYAFKIPDWPLLVKDKPDQHKLAAWVYEVPEHF